MKFLQSKRDADGGRRRAAHALCCQRSCLPTCLSLLFLSHSAKFQLVFAASILTVIFINFRRRQRWQRTSPPTKTATFLTPQRDMVKKKRSCVRVKDNALWSPSGGGERPKRLGSAGVCSTCRRWCYQASYPGPVAFAFFNKQRLQKQKT